MFQVKFLRGHYEKNYRERNDRERNYLGKNYREEYHWKKTLATLAASLLLFASAQDRTDWPEELVFGIIPVEGSADTTERFAPLVAHLEAELGLSVEPNIGADYAAVVIAMEGGNVDFALFGPQSYVEAAERAGAEAFALEDALESGTGYNSIIITNAATGIESLEAAKERTFAYVDPNSTSGYLVPRAHFLLNMDTDPEAFFSEVIFGGTHEANILSVINNSVDVAATNNLDFDKIIAKGGAQMSDVRVLWTSDTIPGSPLAYRGDLPQSLKDALKEAVLSFDDAAGLEAMGLKGYVATDDANYDPIRDLGEASRLAGE